MRDRQAAIIRKGFIVAPGGQLGGGMGRVKDYILEAPASESDGVILEGLVTRDERGFGVSALLMVKAMLRIWREQLRGRLAFVHINLGDKGSAVRKGLIALICRLFGAKVILHLHAVVLKQQYEQGGWLVRRLIALPFRAATVNIVLGELWRRWLTEELGVPRKKVSVLANGVPVPPYTGRDHKRTASQGQPFQLLFLGNLIERKGVSDLIRALELLSPALPPWRMTFAGGGDLYRYRRMIEGAGLSACVRFAGWVDQEDARALLTSADMLVLPSYDEGLPLVILEALGTGTPVVCTAVGAIPEFLTSEETAIFVPPGDPAVLAGAIARLLTSPELRQHLADTGRDSYERTFSLKAFREALFTIYRRTGVIH